MWHEYRFLTWAERSLVSVKLAQVTADLAPAFVRDVGADKVEFKFKKPTSINVGGSYATRCIAKPDMNIDLFVGLPKVLLLWVISSMPFEFVGMECGPIGSMF